MGDHADNTAGFSLIETLMVLVIISLMTGVVVLSMPREKPAIESHASMMASQFSTAAQTSIISGKPQAFGFVKDVYFFYEFDAGEWQIVSETYWPDDIAIEFSKDDLKIETPKDPVPIVVFEPLGLSTAFSLQLEGDDKTIVFSSSGDGKVLMGSSL